MESEPSRPNGNIATELLHHETILTLQKNHEILRSRASSLESGEISDEVEGRTDVISKHSHDAADVGLRRKRLKLDARELEEEKSNKMEGLEVEPNITDTGQDTPFNERILIPGVDSCGDNLKEVGSIKETKTEVDEAGDGTTSIPSMRQKRQSSSESRSDEGMTERRSAKLKEKMERTLENHQPNTESSAPPLKPGSISGDKYTPDSLTFDTLIWDEESSNEETNTHITEQKHDEVKDGTKDKRTLNLINTITGPPVEGEVGERRCPSPARNTESCIISIRNLVRPFTLNQLKDMLARTGTLVQEGFWTDKIKSKCYCTYSTVEEAVETRRALHGTKWPASNPKDLIVDYADQEELLFHKTMPAEVARPKAAIQTVEHWGRSEERGEGWSSGWVTRVSRSDQPQDDRRPHRSRDVSEGSRSRERRDRRDVRDRSVNPERPLKLLDEMFRKTRTIPFIYWMPLTKHQIKSKEEARNVRKLEREKRHNQLDDTGKLIGEELETIEDWLLKDETLIRNDERRKSKEETLIINDDRRKSKEETLIRNDERRKSKEETLISNEDRRKSKEEKSLQNEEGRHIKDEKSVRHEERKRLREEKSLRNEIERKLREEDIKSIRNEDGKKLKHEKSKRHDDGKVIKENRLVRSEESRSKKEKSNKDEERKKHKEDEEESNRIREKKRG